eukprot:4469159-Karenia_brevis.AAC.1
MQPSHTPTSDAAGSPTDDASESTKNPQDDTTQADAIAPKTEDGEAHGDPEHDTAEPAEGQAKPVSTDGHAAEEPPPSPHRRLPQGVNPVGWGRVSLP